jgi:hypothetical protein
MLEQRNYKPHRLWLTTKSTTTLLVDLMGRYVALVSVVKLFVFAITLAIVLLQI